MPVGSTPTDTIGPRSRARLSPRYVLVVLKWRKNRSIFKARRVFSFDIVQSDSFPCQPADKHNREAFACESDHSRLATIIVDVPLAVENLPVVWMAYNQNWLYSEKNITEQEEARLISKSLQLPPWQKKKRSSPNFWQVPIPFQWFYSFFFFYLSQDINECQSSPCLNSGTCKDLVNAYQCTCPLGYTGLQCELGEGVFFFLRHLPTIQQSNRRIKEA